MALASQELGSLQDQITPMIGTFVSFLLTGGLIVSGMCCVFLLIRGKNGTTKQHRFLCIYVIALLFAVVGYAISLFLSTGGVLILYLQSPRKAQQLPCTMTIPTYLCMMAVYALTDGLLVWRCFMICRGLHHSLLPNCRRIAWIFPACICILALVSACIAPGFQGRALYSELVLAAVILGIILDLYGTTLITATLLAHRRIVKSLSGTASTPQHLPIIAILLESAAINIPATVAVAVGVIIGDNFQFAVMPVVTTNHALGSVLIIYQVALGRAFGHRGEEEVGNTTQLVFQGCKGDGRGSSDNGGLVVLTTRITARKGKLDAVTQARLEGENQEIDLTIDESNDDLDEPIAAPTRRDFLQAQTVMSRYLADEGRFP
ncbi:hypothetical protein P691DRAFT_761993 [Macrolepiota fuliginosa MF-IS2]|uniref:Uncharacterized protein n=1 Tax=Macrolepiota fuliginosa MF-IS2 TaxID=1400762 RepID=A0A9P5X9R6_9AGAR|nr:hypothetical protein P691DRAFT_761993 [Macrolepiota fuliginosa MF-IS2]